MIVYHWVRLVAENEAVLGGGSKIQDREIFFFYVNNGLVASTNTVWIQWLSGVVIGIFEQVGMRNNMSNIVTMVCQPIPIVCRYSTPTYGRRMNGKGDSHQLRQIHRVIFIERKLYLVTASLVVHMETQHRWSGCASTATAPALLPSPLVDYQVDFPHMAP